MAAAALAGNVNGNSDNEWGAIVKSRLLSVHVRPGSMPALSTVESVRYHLSCDTAVAARACAQTMAHFQRIPFTALLDALAPHVTGVLLLNSQLQLRFADRFASALIDRRDPFVIDGQGRLRCRDRGAQQRLEAFVGRLSGSTSEPSTSPKLASLVPRVDEGPLSVLVSRHQLVPGQVSFLFVLRDPERAPGLDIALLADIFDLTHAEAAVVAGVVAGYKPSQIAEQRGVVIATVRCQLKAARAKIGVNGQAELVSRVLRTMLI